jgi:hypothetical protein
LFVLAVISSHVIIVELLYFHIAFILGLSQSR